jgi:drug/metabolite transporter (DMT)-like permease
VSDSFDAPVVASDQEADPAAEALKRRRRWEQLALILVSGLLYSVGIASVGIASRYVAPVPLTVLRLLIASLVFAAILLYTRPAVRWQPRLVLDVTLIGLGNVGVPFLLLAASLHYISGSLAAALFNVTPAMTVVLAHFLLRDERLRLNTLVGTGIAVGGALVLLASNSSGLSTAESQGWIGQLLIILASAVGACAVVYTRVRVRQVDTTVLAAGQVMTSLVIFSIIALLTGNTPRVASYPGQAWVAIVAAGVIAPVFGFWLLFYMVQKYSATLGGFAGIATPLFSAAIGMLVLGDVLT